MGYFLPSGITGSKIIQRLTMAGLFILLGAMGAQLGSNGKVLANLDKIGFQAFILASCTVLGSVALVFAAFRWLQDGTGEESREREGKN